MERKPRCPAPDRYSHLYDGNSHVLDHRLISPSYAFDMIHTNAEFASINQPTDHDPHDAR